MDANRDFEALKLIADWSKWIVTLQPAAIAAIGGLVKLNDHARLGIWTKLSLTGAVVCFLYSILVAANLLYCMPRVLGRLSRPKIVDEFGSGTPVDIFMIETHEERHYDLWYNRPFIRFGLLRPPFTVRMLTSQEHMGFIAGIAFFALFVITLSWK